LSARPRLWIVDPSIRIAEEQGIGEVLRGWLGASRVFRPGLRRGDGPGPETGHATDGIVVLGSSASVHDREGWIEGLAAWLRPVVFGEIELPLLGICFGHQLIAHLAGGEVGYLRPDRGRRFGIETSRLAGGRLVAGERELRVVVSHREEVRRVPPGFEVTAGRAGVTADGLEHRTLPVFSFQFHPEAREEFAVHSGIDPAQIDDRVRADSEIVLEAFREIVRARSGVRRGEAVG
jgi:GMP synthase-like glutamine amidotransferase